MLNLVLFGPPGAGKGTQSVKLIEQYQLVHLSTGDILRGEIKAQTDLGKQAKVLIDKGELVPDDVVIGMIRSKIAENQSGKGFIFDGFPRTVAQAEALDAMLGEFGTGISTMLSLQVSEEELFTRLLKRGQESGRSDDQDEGIIRNRIKEYETKTLPVAQFYAQQGKLRSVDGLGTVEEIFNRLCGQIDTLSSNS